MGYIEKAKNSYNEAYKYIDFASKSDKSKYYLSKGNFYVHQKNYNEAKKLYEKAMEMASLNNSIEHLHSIYYGLYIVSDKLGDSEKALEFFKLYNKYYKDIVNFKKSQKYSRLQMMYNDLQYKDEIHKKNTFIMVSLFISILILIILVFLILMYIRKNQTYRKIVKQYNAYRESILRMKQSEDAKKDTACKSMYPLYEQLENMMKNDKIYRRSDLTVQKISEMLCTNTTYISNIINQFSGKSFPNYLNSYRIEDVLDSLSNPENTDSIVTIFKNAGYTSNTTSYRAFQKEVGCTPMQYRKEVLKIKSNITEI